MATAQMTNLADIADPIVQTAQSTSASPNHVLVHRQLIGELREALKGHTFVTPDEPRAKLTMEEARNTICTGCGLTLYACLCPSENRTGK